VIAVRVGGLVGGIAEIGWKAEFGCQFGLGVVGGGVFSLKIKES
jgi:hypothetical protein